MIHNYSMYYAVAESGAGKEMNEKQKNQICKTEQAWLQNTNYLQYCGAEHFSFDGKELFSVLDMWKHCYSHLANQSAVIAEFIVAQALGCTKAENVSYWTAYDMTYRGMRIEVKSTSYVHPWNKRRISNQRVFSIAPSNNKYWDINDTRSVDSSRQSDIYIFCLSSNKDIAASDPLDLNAWYFYVVPTNQIDSYAENNGNILQKTISLNAVRRLAGHQVRYDELKGTVDSIIDGIISEWSYQFLEEGGERPVSKEVTLEQFVNQAEDFVRGAALGEHITIRTGRGLNAVLIDETEWTMLRQALALCMEHPEWTTEK